MFFTNIYFYTYINFSRGKESTEVRITQNKGKESEKSYSKSFYFPFPYFVLYLNL